MCWEDIKKNHIKYSVETRQKEKKAKKEKRKLRANTFNEKKIVTNMVDSNPTDQ